MKKNCAVSSAAIASYMYVATITPHRVTILISADFFLGIIHIY